MQSDTVPLATAKPTLIHQIARRRSTNRHTRERVSTALESSGQLAFHHCIQRFALHLMSGGMQRLILWKIGDLDALCASASADPALHCGIFKSEEISRLDLLHRWHPMTAPRWNSLSYMKVTHSFTNVCRNSLHAKVLDFIHWSWELLEHLISIIWIGERILVAIWCRCLLWFGSGAADSDQPLGSALDWLTSEGKMRACLFLHVFHLCLC